MSKEEREEAGGDGPRAGWRWGGGGRRRGDSQGGGGRRGRRRGWTWWWGGRAGRTGVSIANGGEFTRERRRDGQRRKSVGDRRCVSWG